MENRSNKTLSDSEESQSLESIDLCDLAKRSAERLCSGSQWYLFNHELLGLELKKLIEIFREVECFLLWNDSMVFRIKLNDYTMCITPSNKHPTGNPEINIYGFDFVRSCKFYNKWAENELNIYEATGFKWNKEKSLLVDVAKEAYLFLKQYEKKKVGL